MNEKDIVKVVITELTERGLLKKKISTFETTKELLRNLNRIESSVKRTQKQINSLNNTVKGLVPKVPSGTNFDKTDGETLISVDQIDQKINSLKQSQIIIKEFVKYVKDLIDEVLSDDEQDLISKFYFEKKDINDLCAEYDCEQSTIYRRLNRYINLINVELFPEKYIDELYN